METAAQITFKNIAHSDFLEAHINKRIAQLERVHSRITSCRVVLEAPFHSSEAKPPLGISIEVEVPRRTLIAKEAEPRHDSKNDGLGVINRAFASIEQQLEDDARMKRGEVKNHARERNDGE
jgi:ribosome-associated translation inhibitor RaiA